MFASLDDPFTTTQLTLETEGLADIPEPITIRETHDSN